MNLTPNGFLKQQNQQQLANPMFFFNDLGLPITVLFLVIVLGLAKSHCFGNPHYFSIFFWGLPLADIVSCHQDSSRVGADEHRCLRFGRGAR